MAKKTDDKKNFTGCLPEIGVDIVEIDRFELDHKKDAEFLRRIFSSQELKYCFGRPLPSQHLAARFAAKEATVKALSAMGIRINDWKKIKISGGGKDIPKLTLPAKFNYSAKISLSHNKTAAIAMVLISKLS